MSLEETESHGTGREITACSVTQEKMDMPSSLKPLPCRSAKAPFGCQCQQPSQAGWAHLHVIGRHLVGTAAWAGSPVPAGMTNLILGTSVCKLLSKRFSAQSVLARPHLSCATKHRCVLAVCVSHEWLVGVMSCLKLELFALFCLLRPFKASCFVSCFGE